MIAWSTRLRRRRGEPKHVSHLTDNNIFALQCFKTLATLAASRKGIDVQERFLREAPTGPARCFR